MAVFSPVSTLELLTEAELIAETLVAVVSTAGEAVASAAAGAERERGDFCAKAAIAIDFARLLIRRGQAPPGGHKTQCLLRVTLLNDYCSSLFDHLTIPG